MLLFVGLGNPGAKYARNRHNIGFMAADAIVRRHGFGAWRKRFQGLLAEGSLSGRKVMMLKPQTYMNESGRAVGQAMRFFKLGPEDVVVFHDELDLAPGKLRVKTGGGPAGHNGLRSLDAHIGKGYRRVRLGIGHPGAKERVHGYVLSDFAKADADWLDPLLEAVAEAAPLLAQRDDGAFMSKVAHLAGPAKAKPETGRAAEARGASPPTETEPEGAGRPSGLRAALERVLGRKTRRGGADGL